MSYVCTFCGKVCVKKFGLRNHLKGCKAAPQDANLADAYNEALDNSSNVDDDYIDEVEDALEDRDRKDMYSDISRKPRNDKTPPITKGDEFQVGAFMVMVDHIPLLLDINFAIAVGEHILEHGSENRAVLAFGHKLCSLDA